MSFNLLKQFSSSMVLRSGALALGVSGLVLACAGFDADGDGFYTDPALCGLPLYDCDDSDRGVGHGEQYFYDCDNDGYGDLGSTVYLCDAEKCGEDALVCETVSNSLDCNDRQASNDPGSLMMFTDCDQDGLGDPTRYVLYCSETDPEIPTSFNGCGLVLNGDDCNDNPFDLDAASLSQPVKEAYWFDCDGDQYGDDDIGPVLLCPGAEDLAIAATIDINQTCADLIQLGGDCDDRDANVNPARGNCGG